jgi:hypothetical protein
MTDFLNSVKADLLDRRLLPILAAVGVAFAAALLYAVLGGSSPSATVTPAPAPATVATGLSGVAVSQAPTNPNEAVAETTSGAGYQRAGATRNPFAPLPGSTTTTKPATSSPSAPSAPTPSATAPSSSAPAPAAATKPSSPEKPAKVKKPKTVYRVTVMFGVPTPATSTGSTLPTYENLTRQQPLPSASQPLVVFRGVTVGGKSATFTLLGEAILHGTGSCLPNASQCEAIDLQVGQSEELEYLPPSGAAITYRLQVVSITPRAVSAAAASRAFRGESKVGRELLKRIGLTALPYLRYSTRNGVLVFGGRSAFDARAHAAARDGL